MRYVSIKEVIGQLSRAHKRLQLDIGDIADWCYDVVREYGVFEGFEPFHVRVEVFDGRAALPSNVYRVDKVGPRNDACYPCDQPGFCWSVQGECVHVPNSANLRHVHIRGLSFRVDEEGYPLIPEVLVTACRWYCLSQMLLDSTYAGTMPGQALQDARQQFADSLHTAKGSLQFVSQDEMDRISRRLRSFFPERPRR